MRKNKAFGSVDRCKHQENKGFPNVVAQMVATDTPENGSKALISVAETDPELMRVVSVWPKLSAVVKRMILAALDADRADVVPANRPVNSGAIDSPFRVHSAVQ